MDIRHITNAVRNGHAPAPRAIEHAEIDHAAVEQGNAAAKRHGDAAAYWYDLGDPRRAAAEAHLARLACRSTDRLRLGLATTPPA